MASDTCDLYFSYIKVNLLLYMCSLDPFDVPPHTHSHEDAVEDLANTVGASRDALRDEEREEDSFFGGGRTVFRI